MNDIGWAIQALKKRQKVRRRAWGEGVYLSNSMISGHYHHITLHTAQGFDIHWRCPESDLLADDWEEVE